MFNGTSHIVNGHGFVTLLGPNLDQQYTTVQGYGGCYAQISNTSLDLYSGYSLVTVGRSRIINTGDSYKNITLVGDGNFTNTDFSRARLTLDGVEIRSAREASAKARTDGRWTCTGLCRVVYASGIYTADSINYNVTV